MIKDKIKQLLGKTEQGDSKKKIENLAVFLVILVVTIIIINLILGGNNKKSEKEPATDPNKKLAMLQENSVMTANLNVQDDLTYKLEEILKKMAGVGEVKVLITYSQSSQTVPLYNEDTSQKDTQETDTSRRK